MFTLGLIIGVVIGTIFHAVIVKWWGKGKATAQEIAKDVKAEVDKTIKK